MTTEPSFEQKVQELWDREQIRQCLVRYCRGVDRFDRDLILSAFHPDCLDEHGKFVGTPEEFVDWALGQHGAAHQSRALTMRWLAGMRELQCTPRSFRPNRP